MENKSEKELSGFVARDIVQEYFKNGSGRNIVLLQNSEKHYINLISCLIANASLTKTDRTVEILNAANIQSIPEPENGVLVIIRDPGSIMNYSGKARDRSYTVDINGLLNTYRNSRLSRGEYHQPSSHQHY